ncbi:MAG: type II secretion system F family protein [Candidatus Diapherotrites archaeon]|uniref:Type II secretion system F family protein n=1 Tax=Candidatus Iainarchaeum sp. TaxID=3101447 RepID=A0A8T4KTL8_9ARCH|nr:type II secretion system F family protein [Candidatus Diapherotrites archaeon]
MKLEKMHWLGIAAGFVIIVTSVILFWNKRSSDFFPFLIGLGLAVSMFPFIFALVIENKRQQEISERFLEFSRNLAESVTTGTPISKSIVNMSRKNYGALSPHIVKLGNQISLGIPVNQAFQNFAHDVENPVISRAVSLMSEAERAGGEIDYILESVSNSIAEVEKLRQERRAAISGLVVQGYIIFFIFIAIMLIMEFKILPVATQISSIGSIQGDNPLGAPGNSENLDSTQLARLFLYLLLTQGFFTGLVIGKLAEGSIKAGIKHSFIMMISAFLITTGIKLLFGGTKAAAGA